MKRNLPAIAFLILCVGFLQAESTFTPSLSAAPLARPGLPHMIPVTLIVRQFDPRPALEGERIPGAQVRLAVLFKPVRGRKFIKNFTKTTDANGECHFLMNPALFEEMDWACEAEKRLPDGRILREVGLPATGKISRISERQETLRSMWMGIYLYDINASDWPIGVGSFEMPPQEEDIDQNPIPPPDPFPSSDSEAN